MRITNWLNVIQYRGYQPPEYIDKGEISEKFDIFSLGVVMIRIMSGPHGYPKCLDMSSDEFIDQVRNDISYKQGPFLNLILSHIYIGILYISLA